MCFDLSWTTGLRVDLNELWLSQNNEMGSGTVPWIQEDSVRSYIASLIPSARARASASVEDATTVDCLFDAQETGLPADSKTYPVMDFRSTWQLPSPSVYIPKW